jgi:hypothetical protein
MAVLYVLYYREDCGPAAEALGQRLAQLGNHRLSWPVPSDAMTAARDLIVRQSDVVLVLIGPQWLFITDHRGQRRITNRADFLHFDLTRALSHRKPIVPIIVGAGIMPAAQQLPSDLRALAQLTPFHLHDTMDVTADAIRLNIKLRQFVDA